MHRKTTSFLLAILLGVSVLAVFLQADDAEAIFTCLKAKSNQNDCGNSSCHRLPTSLAVLSSNPVPWGHSGWWPGGKCGWKFCSTLVCSCGDPLSSGSCTGEDPCG